MRIGILGAGRVGLPLALVLAVKHSNASVYACDRDAALVTTVNSGHFPFVEREAQDYLNCCLGKNLTVGVDPAPLRQCQVLVVALPTGSNKLENDVTYLLNHVAPHLAEQGDVVICSTLTPGTTERFARELAARGHNRGVAYCPERTAEGAAIPELLTLPQLVSATASTALAAAKRLFAFAPAIVEIAPLEAEYAKLIGNAWRYAQFALANQFYMLTAAAGLNFNVVFAALKNGYPRANAFCSPGFAGGPCLEKDTRILADAGGAQFAWGAAAVNVNRSFVDVLASQVAALCPDKQKTVGILGMAFKKNSDDARNSLSYALRDRLAALGFTVLCSDPYLTDPGLVPEQQVLGQAEVIVIGAPHSAYADLRTTKTLLNVWQPEAFRP